MSKAARQSSPRNGPASSDWGSLVQAPMFMRMAATGAGIYLCYRLAAPFIPSLAWALALAVLFNPIQHWIESRLNNRGLAAVLSVFVTALIVFGMATFVGQRLVQEASKGADLVKTKLESGVWRHELDAHPRLAPLADWMERQNLPTTLKAIAAWMTTTGASFVKRSVTEAIGLPLTLYLLFFFLRDRRTAIETLRSFSPLSKEDMDLVLHRVSDTIHATVYGTLAIAGVQGLLGGLMFWWLGLSAPLLWGVVMGLLAVVPMLGAFVVWIPAALFLTFEGSWGKALILTIWGGLVVGTIDNLLRPILVGKRLKLHTVLAFISAVGGLVLFGPSGLILGPVSLAITLALLQTWRHPIASNVTESVEQDALSRLENEGGPPIAEPGPPRSIFKETCT